MVLEGSARMRCVKSAGSSTGGRSTARLGCDVDISVDHSRVLATDRRAKGAHDGVAHPGRPSLAGMTTTVADPELPTLLRPPQAGAVQVDPFNRREQRASGLIHRGARMLVRDVAHEARNGGEASAGGTCCTSSDRRGTERKQAPGGGGLGSDTTGAATRD